METKIKICGLKTVEDIYIINRYPVDYVGFVLAPSKRQITPDQAKEMGRNLYQSIKKVGVFVNTPMDEVNQIAEYCQLDIVQLHGDEKPEDCEKAIVPVWKSVTIKNQLSLEELCHYQKIDGFLMDGANAGSGKTFDWHWIECFSQEYFTILAGGLSAENIHEAIRQVKPHVVDISSGVEVDGRKNEEKIKEFIRRVKSYGNES